jgi:hypothetical protein
MSRTSVENGSNPGTGDQVPLLVAPVDPGILHRRLLNESKCPSV